MRYCGIQTGARLSLILSSLLASAASLNLKVSLRRNRPLRGLSCQRAVSGRDANTALRHSRAGGNPVAFDFVFCKFLNSKWIPAYAGMTVRELSLRALAKQSRLPRRLRLLAKTTVVAWF